jgi:alkylresorcinol/alkylpyrone synthase
MRIAAVGSALPEHYYDQETLTRYLMKVWADDPGVLRRLPTLHENTCVAGRHLAYPLERYDDFVDFTACNEAWLDAALDLGERAIRQALQTADLSPADVDAIFFSTVTGLASPSLDALLCNRMAMRSDLVRVPMFGLGCVAGAAAVSRAADFVRHRPNGVALVLTVELCSLTLQRGDRSVANLISVGLFGDGASAAVVVGGDRPAAGPEILATRSVFYPDTEAVMGWKIGSHGFEIRLSPDVPAVARERLPEDVTRFVADCGLQPDAIQSYVCHPGGPKVLQAMQEGLGLSAEDLRHSWAALERCGNLSSASVLLILQSTMRQGPPLRGSHGLMLAMGPGFCSELLLLRW